MLKNLGYDGAYHDGNISVSAILENPLDYGLEASALVFGVTLKAKGNGSATPKLDDFTFYVMDETNRLYNAQSVPYLKPGAEMPDGNEPVRCPDALIHTAFRHEFLFQDLRVAFYYRLYTEIKIIGLKH